MHQRLAAVGVGATIAALGYLVQSTSVTGAIALWSFAGGLVLVDLVLVSCQRGRRSVQSPALPLAAGGPPNLDLEACVQGEDVYIKVVNEGSPGEFAGRVTHVERFDRSLATPWVIPWRDHAGQWQRLGTGQEEGWLLHLATTDGMGTADGGTVRDNLLGTASWMWRFRTLDAQHLARIQPRGSAHLDVVIERKDGGSRIYRLEVGFADAGKTASNNLVPRVKVTPKS